MTSLTIIEGHVKKEDWRMENQDHFNVVKKEKTKKVNKVEKIKHLVEVGMELVMVELGITFLPIEAPSIF